MHFLICFIVLCLSVCRADDLQPRHVAVVYNERSDFSRECAKRYAELRGIPAAQVVGIFCAVREEVSRKEFDAEVLFSLEGMVDQRNWWLPTRIGQAGNGSGAEIYALVLMPDLPLKVREEPRAQGQPWQQTTAAAVDSELALLGVRDVPRAGMLRNPYYGQDENFVMSGYPVMLVSRIEAPSKEACRRMIEDPVQAEKDGGLWGWMAVDAGGPYGEGDKWMQSIVTGASGKGVPVLLDSGRETFPSLYPLPGPLAVYFGWYAGEVNGPFADASFRFAKGAVAVHLHSFSATTMKSPVRTWSGPLLERGAAVTLGNVYEPFLGGSHHLDVFYDRLLKGYSVAEAAAMAAPAFSWQCVVFGDPLYRPFAGMKREGMKKDARSRLFQAWFVAVASWGGKEDVLAAQVEKAARQPGNAGLWEVLASRALVRKDFSKAVRYLSEALLSSTGLGDRVRLQLLLADAYKGNGQEAECIGELRRMLMVLGNTEYAEMIRKKASVFPALKALAEDPAARSSKVK